MNAVPVVCRLFRGGKNRLRALAKTCRGYPPQSSFVTLRGPRGHYPACGFKKQFKCSAGGLPPLLRWQKPPSGTRKNISWLSPSKFLRHFAGTPWTLSCVWFQKTIQMRCRWFAASSEVAKTAFGHSQKHIVALLCISRLRRFFRRAPSLLRKRKRRRRRKHLTVTK